MAEADEVAQTTTYAKKVEQQSVDAVNMVDELQRAREERVSSGLFQCEKGPVLKLKKFPQRLIMDGISKLTEPKPPVVEIPEKFREEENPNDPQYIKDRDAYNMKLVSTMYRINLGFGTEIVGYGDCEPPEESVWADDLKDLVEIDVPAVGTKGRYVMWLQYHVLSDVELNELNNAIVEFNTGVKIGDVEAAAATFPGVSEGGADTAGAAETPESAVPHSGNGSTESGAGVRAEGGSEVLSADVGAVQES